MKQQLLDIIEHTVFACSVDRVRICANGLAHIHAITSDKQVVLYGHCNTPPTKCYGIADNGELYSLLSNPNLSLVSQNENLLTFQNSTTGNSFVYSFINEQRIAELVPFIKLNAKPESKFESLTMLSAYDIERLKKSANAQSLVFDAIATLPNNFVEKLKQQAKVAKAGDDLLFNLFEVESYINFRFGDWSTQVQGNVFFPANYSSVGSWWWDINVLIKILSQSGQFKLGIFSNSYMGIQCITEYAEYNYLLPALKK